jgi:large subunit ribosomal protein L14
VKKSKEIKKGQICTALVLRIKRYYKRWGNFYFKSAANSVILVNKYFLPIGSRIIGPVFREIRANLKFNKVISLAQVTL